MAISSTDGKQIRFTRDELSKIRARAAKYGYAINTSDIKTTNDALEVLIKAAPDELAEKMLEFIENRIKDK